MIAALGFALVKTFVTFMFESYLKNNYTQVDIEGAPSWYMRNVKGMVCKSDFEDGGIDKIKETKNKTLKELEESLKDSTIFVLREKFKDLPDNKKEIIIKLFNNKNFEYFISHKAQFKDIYYDKEHNRVFVRVCIRKEDLENYLVNASKNLKVKLQKYDANQGFNELDSDDFDKDFEKDDF